MLDDLSHDELAARQRALSTRYGEHRRHGLRLDLTRGKPSAEQLALSDAMEHVIDGDFISDGVDARNYGGLTGLAGARALGAALLGVQPEEVIAGGNASLTLMYQYLLGAWLHGPLGPETAWRRETGVLKFLCVVPGYDRHFTITQELGFELINVRMRADGPDMDQIEALVGADPHIKGIWCVPKYSNPSGEVYSDAVVDRFARLATMAGPHFRIIWDNAYAMHDLDDDPPVLANVLERCRAAGTADSVVVFGSTSKVTRAGAGVSFMAASPGNLAAFTERLAVQTIGPDKLNQLRHIRFLKDADGLRAHMRRHAAIVRPKFELVLRHLRDTLGADGIATWSTPRGGYFISFETPPGVATDTVRLAGEAGLTLTPAGAPFPYGRDPADRNIRLAPTFSSLEEIDRAMPLFVTAVQLAAVRKRLAGLF